MLVKLVTVVKKGSKRMFSSNLNGFSVSKGIRFACLVSLSVLCSTVFSATYFVDPANGLDTNAGSELEPYKSIEKGLSATIQGDTILLKDGNYPYLRYVGKEYTASIEDTLSTDTKWVTIRAINQHQAVINYADNTGKRCVDLGNNYGSNGTIKLQTLIFDGIAFNGKFYTNNIIGLRVKNCISYSKDNFVDMSSYECGFSFGGNNASGDIVIENSQIYHHFKGISANAYNLKIQNCDIYDIGCHHIWLSGYDNILIEGNTIRDHTKFSDDHGDAIIVYSTRPLNNIIIRKNKIYNHQNLGIFISWASSTLINSFVLENNLIYDIGGYAVNLQNINGAKIAHNTIDGAIRLGTEAAINLQNIESYGNIIRKYYVYQYDASRFTNLSNNIYVIGAGGGGYTNLGSYEYSSLAIPKDTNINDIGLFTDAINKDYTLASNSRAVNFGTSLNAPSTDILGNSRDATPDAGCYEYTGNTTKIEPNIPVELNIAPIDNQKVLEGNTVSFNVVVDGAPADSITCTIDNLPAGATFTDNTFNWTPVSGQAGLYFPKISATCGDVNAVKFVAITVEANAQLHYPTITVSDNVTILEGEKLELAVSAFDPDGDSLLISANNLPYGALFYNNTLYWVPEYGKAGSYVVQISAYDGQNEAIKNIKVTVTKAETQTYTGKRLIYFWQNALSLLGEI